MAPTIPDSPLPLRPPSPTQEARAERLSTRDRALVLGIWLALGLLETAKGYFNARLLGRHEPWTRPLIDNLPWWLAWAALTPVVIGLARRFRLERGSPAVAVHVAASVVLALLHHVVVGTLYYYTHTRGSQLMLGGQLRPFTLQIQLWN